MSVTSGMNDERLRAAYAKVVSEREPQTRAACVSPEALLTLVQRDGAEDVRLRILDHAMACPACGQDLALLRAVHATKPRPARRVAAFALAASVLLATAITLTVRSRVNTGEPALMRGVDDVTLVSPLGTAPIALPVTLVWHRVPSATGYDVTVLDGDGVRVVQRTTADTSVTLAAEPQLRANVDYVWTVTAHLPDNADRRSTPAMLRLRTP